MASVVINDDIKKKYPSLAAVLRQVATKKEEDLNIDRSRYEKYKSEWLKYETVYQGILNINKIKWKQRSQDMLSPQQSQFWASFERFFSATEFLASPDFAIGVLGINQNAVEHLVADEMCSWPENSDQEIQVALGEYLEAVCVKLTEYFDGIDYATRRKVVQSRAIHLHDMIRSDRDKLSEMQQDLKETSEKAVNYFIDINLLLTSCAELLCKMMSKYHLKLQRKKDEIEMNKLRCHMQMIALKAKSLRLKLMMETYSKENVKCLKRIKEVLVTKIGANNVEIKEIEDKLAAYKGLGSEYQEIVDEYTKVLKELERQKWMLEEVKRRTGNADIAN